MCKYWINFSKGPASCGSSKRLKDFNKLPMTKVKMYLETKPSSTKHRAQRLNFPRLKLIVDDLNEIWSFDLAQPDKLAKYNHDVKCLLVAVDCLSRYLCAEPLKTKHNRNCKNVPKHDQKHATTKSLGTWWYCVLGGFRNTLQQTSKSFVKYFWQKKMRLRRETSDHLKKLFTDNCRKNEWAYSYINNLDHFIKNVNSRFICTTKIAPNKDVPRLVSLPVETLQSQKQNLYVGDFVRIVKKEETFRKGYKQSFTDGIFEIAGVLTHNTPTYSLIDSNKEIIQGKFFQPELQLIRESPNQN